MAFLLTAKSFTLAFILHKKQMAMINLFKYAIDKRKGVITFVQKFLGTLSFLNLVIVPGHVFTRANVLPTEDYH